jgi:predicted nuclease of restriction endonuclease-like RecB superfamily
MLKKRSPCIIQTCWYYYFCVGRFPQLSRKTFQEKRIYDFALDHARSLIFSIESETAEIGFDSAIEKEFYQLGFAGWNVQREPTVLQAGKYAFIPDFSLERNDTRIYVEIIGFWTPEYLKHKIQKLNQLQEKESMILLVNSLACTGSEFRAENLLFYDKKKSTSGDNQDFEKI